MTRALHNLVRDAAKRASFGLPYGGEVLQQAQVKKMSDKEIALRTRALRAAKKPSP